MLREKKQQQKNGVPIEYKRKKTIQIMDGIPDVKALVTWRKVAWKRCPISSDRMMMMIHKEKLCALNYVVRAVVVVQKV